MRDARKEYSSYRYKWRGRDHDPRSHRDPSLPTMNRKRKDRTPPSASPSSTFLAKPTAAADDRETPQRALCDVAPLLRACGTGAGLAVYDPYFCRGGLKRLLLPLLPANSSVHNEPEDFYRVKREGRCPRHDVLLTNPPFSQDHIRRAMEFCVSRKQPWMMLLPHNVVLRAWFSGVVARDVEGQPPMFVCPHERYAFQTNADGGGRDDGGGGGGSGGAGQDAHKHVPFVTIWFVGGLSVATREKMLAAWAQSERSSGATLAQTVEEMPRRIRKILTFAKKRVNKKARKGKKTQRREFQRKPSKQ